MNFFDIPLEPGTGLSSADDQQGLLELIRPKPSPVPLVRLGPGGDGTYLVPDDLSGIAACFSPGVDGFKDFEDVLARGYGIAAHLCDGANEADDLRTPLIEGKQTFEKLWLDVTGAPGTVSLDDWVSRHSPDPEDDLILQMDIEGAEYRNILNASDDVLKRFRIIVLEVHDLQEMANEPVLSQVLLPFFERIGQFFTCVHAHPNNWSPAVLLPELGVEIPPLMELTFLRTDRFGGQTLEVELPHPLDIPFNVPDRPLVFLGDFFRGRPPSAAEAQRMREDILDWRHREVVQLFERYNVSAFAQLTAERDAARTEMQRLSSELERLRRTPWNRLRNSLRKRRSKKG